MTETGAADAERLIGKWKWRAAGNSEQAVPRLSQLARLTFGLLG